jgi:hypothetical protein
VLNPEKKTRQSQQWSRDLAREKERWMEGTSSWENIHFNGNFAQRPEKSCYRLRSNSQFSCNNIKHVRGMDVQAPAPSRNLLKHYNRFHFNARVVQFVIFTLRGRVEKKRTWNMELNRVAIMNEEYMTTIINKGKRITIPVDALLSFDRCRMDGLCAKIWMKS